MNHLAVMNKSWGFIKKISAGEKKIESRWYKNKYSPWNKIKAGETVYFKNSGEPIKIKAEIKRVIQFSELTPQKVKKIMGLYYKDLGIENVELKSYIKLFKDKKYCLLIFLKNPVKIKPFEINKRGFGAMAAWITTNKINSIIRK